MEYSRKNVSNLMYHKNLNLIDSIVERRSERFYPQSNRTGLTSGSQIEFVINHDQFSDLATATINFELTFSDVANSYICNAADIFDRVDVFYNDILVESIQDANAWANIFLSHTANLSYLQTEGEALLGTYNAKNAPALGATAGSNFNQKRYYAVPLMLLSGLSRSGLYLPVLGNRLRYVLRLAGNTSVISKYTTAGTTYTVNDVSMLCDTIIVKSDYRSKIMDVIQSQDGLKIPFSTYQCGKLSVTGAQEQNLKISYNLSNALSLFMVYDNQATKEAFVTNVHSLSRQSFPLSSFSSWLVKSGSNYFTPPSAIQGFHENFRCVELATSSLLNLQGSGFIDYSLMTGAYTKAATPDAGTYGLCLLGVNLSKTIEADDGSVVNQGLSAMMNGASSDIDVNIKTSAALTATDNWLYNIVHRRVLEFSNGGASVKY